MPASGGSVTDNSVPTNKVVKGQKHYLAYITPDESKSLVEQGGVPTMTNEGVIAYPPQGDWGGPSYGGGSKGGSGSPDGPDGPPGGGDPDMHYQAPPPAPPVVSPHKETKEDKEPEVTTVKAPPSIKSITPKNELPDYDELATHKQYAPRIGIEEIHGEHDDPDSVSYDPYYNPDAQAAETKEAVLGSGKKAGDWKWNAKTQEYERVQDFTFQEHWDRAPELLKLSPTARLLWATNANLSEWATSQNLGNIFSGGDGADPDPNRDRGDGGITGNDGLGLQVPVEQSNYIATGQVNPSNSVAANWYQSLGSSSAAGNTGVFNLATEYAAAKNKVALTLGTPSAVGMLAVNDSPFFDFLQKHNLTKGIL